MADGKPFVDRTSKELAEISVKEAWDQLLKSQLPEGATLDEMLGACPGAPGQVRLTYFPDGMPRASKITDWETTESESDFAVQWRIEGLKADVLYTSIVEARGSDGGVLTASVRGSFRTAPTSQQAKDLTFCFTTCHDFIRRDDGMKGHKIYPSMTEIGPDFVVHAGDIEYYDKPLPYAMTKELMRFKWARIFGLPNNRQFYNTTSSYFLKDDHDTLKNDCWAGLRCHR